MPTSARNAPNHRNLTAPYPHPTTRPAPWLPLTATAEIADGAPT